MLITASMRRVMATASRLEQYMTQRGIHYDVVLHPRSHSSMETAELAQVPGDRPAKSVILEDDEGYGGLRYGRLGVDAPHRDRQVKPRPESEAGVGAESELMTL